MVAHGNFHATLRAREDVGGAPGLEGAELESADQRGVVDLVRAPKVAEFMKTIKDEAKENAYVDTLFGRRLYFPEIKNRNGRIRAGAERAAINAPMQGTAADIIKRAIRRLEYIELATCLDDLKVPPSNRLHALKGDRKGQYSISINDQWWICFKFVDGDAYEVEITDYH